MARPSKESKIIVEEKNEGTNITTPGDTVTILDTVNELVPEQVIVVPAAAPTVTPIVTTVQPEAVVLRKFVAGDMIPCRCVRPNKVIMFSTKTSMRYEWSGFGDVTEVDYIDLLSLRSAKSEYLFKPAFLIEDAELRTQWAKDLEPIYDKYKNIYETEDLFNMTTSEFETYLRSASKGMREVIKVAAMKGIKEETLTNISIIRLIDDILGTSFKDFL